MHARMSVEILVPEETPADCRAAAYRNVTDLIGNLVTPEDPEPLVTLDSAKIHRVEARTLNIPDDDSHEHLKSKLFASCGGEYHVHIRDERTNKEFEERVRVDPLT